MCPAKTTGEIQFIDSRKGTTANTCETFPHYVIVSEILFEIALPVRNIIFKLLGKTRAVLELSHFFYIIPLQKVI